MPDCTKTVRLLLNTFHEQQECNLFTLQILNHTNDDITTFKLSFQREVKITMFLLLLLLEKGQTAKLIKPQKASTITYMIETEAEFKPSTSESVSQAL